MSQEIFESKLDGYGAMGHCEARLWEETDKDKTRQKRKPYTTFFVAITTCCDENLLPLAIEVEGRQLKNLLRLGDPKKAATKHILGPSYIHVI